MNKKTKSNEKAKNEITNHISKKVKYEFKKNRLGLETFVLQLGFKTFFTRKCALQSPNHGLAHQNVWAGELHAWDTWVVF